MNTVVVRYRPLEDQADHNQALVEAVFAELASTDPGGLSYATLRLADGSFVHIAQIEEEHNPLSENQAFAEFQAGIRDRCLEGEGPMPLDATLVGSYRFLPESTPV